MINFNKVLISANEQRLEYCKRNGLILYRCTKCDLLSYGKLTSYHAQNHGEQEIYYNPFPQEKL